MKRSRYALLLVPALMVGMAFPGAAAAQQPDYNIPAQTECAPLFSNAGQLRLCVSVAARAAANPQLTALGVCSEAGFRGRSRGGRTSDLRKCQLAVLRTVNRILRTTG